MKTSPKSPALEAHVCRFNDGEQICDCFVAGEKSARDECVRLEDRIEEMEDELRVVKASANFKIFSEQQKRILILRKERREMREWIEKNCIEESCREDPDPECFSCQAWDFLESFPPISK